jgi:hypothetical protein
MAARQESREGRASVRLDFGCGRADLLEPRIDLVMDSVYNTVPSFRLKRTCSACLG